MRRLLRILLLPALLSPALPMAARADEPSAQDAVAASRHVHMNWQQRFAKANTAADGHLTMEEAKGGFPLVARHFSDIDIDGKGYVTVKDLKTWYAMRRVARSLRAVPDDGPQPRNAQQRSYPDERPMGTPAATQISAEQ
nr:hypothetical protein [uncultured Rhodopila sp.]